MAFDSVNQAIEKTDFVGITSNFTRSSDIVIDLVKHIKKINPHSKVIIGGIDATVRYEHYLESGADIVVLGEGEIVGPNLLLSLLNGDGPTSVGGIAYRDLGKVIFNPKIGNIGTVPIDEVPLPALDLIPEDLPKYTEAFEGPLHSKVKRPIAVLDTSRGCNHACSFCTTPFVMGNYRFMSTKRINDHLEHFKKYGIRTLSLMEDNILSRLDYPDGKQLLFEFFDLLIQYGFAWEFGNGIEIGKLVNNSVEHDIIGKLFYRHEDNNTLVGCYRVYIPLESLHLHPETVFLKLKNYEKERAVIEAIASTGIPMMTIGIIIGSQDDTDDTLSLARERCLEIRELVESHGVDIFFTPFIDTPLPQTVNYLKNRNMITYNINEFPELYQFHTAVTKSAFFSPESLTITKRKLEEDINGIAACRHWRTTGTYYFAKHTSRT